MKVVGQVPLLQVFDMPTAVDFYCAKLGFQFVSHSPEIEAAEGRYFHWCWLRRDEGEVMLNTAYDANERPPARDPARQAAHGDVTVYFGCDDVDALYAELMARGVAVKPPTVAPYGMKQLGLRDPDGYGLCFQWRV